MSLLVRACAWRVVEGGQLPVAGECLRACVVRVVGGAGDYGWAGRRAGSHCFNLPHDQSLRSLFLVFFGGGLASSSVPFRRGACGAGARSEFCVLAAIMHHMAKHSHASSRPAILLLMRPCRVSSRVVAPRRVCQAAVRRKWVAGNVVTNGPDGESNRDVSGLQAPA